MTSIRNTVLIVVGLLIFTAVTSVPKAEAQSRREAVKAFNQAVDLAAEGKYSQAIASYMQVISISNKLGKSANDIKKKAQSKIPQVYLQKAVAFYKEYQKTQNMEKLNEAISTFKKTRKAAKKYNQPQIAAKAKSIIPQLYYTKAIYHFKTKELKESLAALDKALSLNPEYSKAYYQKGLVLKNMSEDSLLVALDQFDKAIKWAQKNKNSQMVSQAKKAAKSNLVYRGAQAIEAKKYEKAVDLLQRALKYDAQSEDAHYRLAQAYNKLEQYSKALTHANKALKYEKGGRAERAKIYFEKGIALKSLDKKEAACEAFSNAAYGSFKAPAKHEMKYNLKCEQISS